MAALTPAPFTVDADARQGAVVLRLSGDLDIAAEPRLRAELDAATAGGSRVVVDLAGLRFIDSRGMSALLGAASTLAGRLQLRGDRGQVKAALELVQVRERLPFED